MPTRLMEEFVILSGPDRQKGLNDLVERRHGNWKRVRGATVILSAKGAKCNSLGQSPRDVANKSKSAEGAK